VVIRKGKSRTLGRDFIDGAEKSYAKRQLMPYQAVPPKLSHLDLADVGYRFIIEPKTFFH
jgi:hypothetical protein